MILLWSPRAENELAAIVAHIAEDNIEAALALDTHITDCAEQLLQFPKQGKPGRVVGTRELIVHEHYILDYEIAGDELQILSVLHTARQWPPESVGYRSNLRKSSVSAERPCPELKKAWPRHGSPDWKNWPKF